ncbi:MAG: N-acetyl-gamma-glutamyl-phosphate reductase [Fimbriimonadaceae bacterium]|nr:N-acetyl-gamma-glutamyl-phosphate reductase [Fimbriimonadaceae bacterium]
MPSEKIPAIVLGGTGYVAGELIRLLLAHPHFELTSVVSQSAAGQQVGDIFPHLAGVSKSLAFDTNDNSLADAAKQDQVALFSALPHGEAAPILKQWIESGPAGMKVVDLSADFRYADAKQFEEIYGISHPTPELLSEFTCAIPELHKAPVPKHAVQPGCFTTAATLACAPLAALGLASSFVVNGVTGSTGSGRTPKSGTHHPDRHSGMWAYELLKHRHTPEMKMFLGRLRPEGEPKLVFLPHSGPFARGIHATVYAETQSAATTEELIESYTAFYADCPFISVSASMPSVKHVAGSNRAHIGIAAQGTQVAVVCVIDNLIKGAAGGGIQWMNRIFGFDETAGLMQAAVGWT